jgi:hypothetical protein
MQDALRETYFGSLSPVERGSGNEVSASNFGAFTQYGYTATASFRAAGSSKESDGMKRLLREQSPPTLAKTRHRLAQAAIDRQQKVIGWQSWVFSTDCVIARSSCSYYTIEH